MNINPTILNNLIPEPYFTRGKEYYNRGAIRLLKITPDSVIARAEGSRVYNVTLTYKNMQLKGWCSCPAFTDFGPCKHMAATGLALIQHVRSGYKPSEECAEQMNEFDDFNTLLKSKTKKRIDRFYFNAHARLS